MATAKIIPKEAMREIGLQMEINRVEIADHLDGFPRDAETTREFLARNNPRGILRVHHHSPAQNGITLQASADSSTRQSVP